MLLLGQLVRKLKGLRLGYLAKPEVVHGETLAALADALPPEPEFPRGRRAKDADKKAFVTQLAEKLRAPVQNVLR
ncbi:MAG: hypothetical protein DPW14_14335 [Planctomycetes bacterium]|nr:hypothetical protein [Planctomycetota bacterium]